MKGKPDFSSFSDDRLREFAELAQQMIFAYKHCDEGKTHVLTEVWKELSDECTDRLCASACSELNKQVVKDSGKLVTHKIKMVKSIKR